jgi:hypothetical protein
VRGDDAWRERAGTAARAAAAGYEWDAIARQHVELYERLRRAAPDVRPGIR